jgi:hypothetical protein
MPDVVVLAVYVGAAQAVDSVVQPSIECTLEGIVGDRHFGFTKPAGVREPDYERGTIIRNNRQFSALSQEELTKIAASLQVPKIEAEWLGANILLEGMEEFTQLPPLSRLVFDGGAVLRVFGANQPCRYPGDVIQSHYPDHPRLSADFVRNAMQCRGIVGWVEHPGTITAGQGVQVIRAR